MVPISPFDKIQQATHFKDPTCHDHSSFLQELDTRVANVGGESVSSLSTSQENVPKTFNPQEDHRIRLEVARRDIELDLSHMDDVVLDGDKPINLDPAYQTLDLIKEEAAKAQQKLEQLEKEYDEQMAYLKTWRNRLGAGCNFIKKREEYAEGIARPIFDDQQYEYINLIFNKTEWLVDLSKFFKPITRFATSRFEIDYCVRQAKEELKKIQNDYHCSYDSTFHGSGKQKIHTQYYTNVHAKLTHLQNKIRAGETDAKERKIKSYVPFLKKGFCLALASPLANVTGITHKVMKDNIADFFGIIKSYRTFAKTRASLSSYQHALFHLNGPKIDIEKTFNTRKLSQEQEAENFIQSLKACNSLEEIKQQFRKARCRFDLLTDYNHWKKSLEAISFVDELKQHYLATHYPIAEVTQESVINLLEKRKLEFDMAMIRAQERFTQFILKNAEKPFEEVQFELKTLPLILTPDEWATLVNHYKDPENSTLLNLKNACIDELIAKNPKKDPKDIEKNLNELIENYGHHDFANAKFFWKKLDANNEEISFQRNDWEILTLENRCIRSIIAYHEATAFQAEKAVRAGLLQKIKTEKCVTQISCIQQGVDILASTLQIAWTLPAASAHALMYMSRLTFTKFLVDIFPKEVSFPGVGLCYFAYPDLEGTIGGIIKQSTIALIGYLCLRHKKPHLYSFEAYKIHLHVSWLNLILGIRDTLYYLRKSILQLNIYMTDAIYRHCYNYTPEMTAQALLNSKHDLNAYKEYYASCQKSYQDQIKKLEERLNQLSLEDFKLMMQPIRPHNYPQPQSLYDFIDELIQQEKITPQEGDKLRHGDQTDTDKLYSFALDARENEKMTEDRCAAIAKDVEEEQKPSKMYAKKYNSEPFAPLNEIIEKLSSISPSYISKDVCHFFKLHACVDLEEQNKTAWLSKLENHMIKQGTDFIESYHTHQNRLLNNALFQARPRA